MSIIDDSIGALTDLADEAFNKGYLLIAFILIIVFGVWVVFFR